MTLSLKPLDPNQPCPSVDLGRYGTQETEDNYHWIWALYAWRSGSAEILERMIISHPIPVELRPVIAEIITGKQRQNTKGKSNLAEIKHGFYLVKLISMAGFLRGLSDYELLLDPKAGRNTHTISDEKGIEVREVRVQIEKDKKDFIKFYADSLGISVETLGKWKQELVNMLDDYPNVFSTIDKKRKQVNARVEHKRQR